MTVSWQDFEKVDMRVGVVTDAKEFPEARRPAYRLWVDFGPVLAVICALERFTPSTGPKSTQSR